MRVLITGAGGMLGQDLARASAGAGHEVVALGRGDLDITDEAAVRAAIAPAKPDLVFNCAAYTNVDGAETEAQLAHAVNGTGAGHVARAACQSGAWTVHVSSDYVFNGQKRSPYTESDVPEPISEYGRSKRDGEQAVAENAPGLHTIVRSSWLFGTGGPCFPATILRLARERDRLSVVDDQVGCPTFTEHLAEALVRIAPAPPEGILHLAATGQCSWCQLAKEIVTGAGLDCEILPIGSDDLDRPARRPAYSVLRSEHPGAPFLPEWRHGLAAYMSSELVAG